MAQVEPAAQIRVSDGAGGVIPVQDHRADAGQWPVQLRVASEDAKEWMNQLNAECELRGYASNGISQIETGENSGTMQIRLANGATVPTFDLVWERVRDQRLIVKSRPSGTPAPSDGELRAFVDAITTAQRFKRRQRKHRRAYLVTDGHPWSGDLWLTPELCLGPPSQPAPYGNDPQIIVIDAMIDGISSANVNDAFQRLVRELLIFLDVVVGIHAKEQRDERVWTYETEDGIYTSFDLRRSAYYELALHPQMPIAGVRPAMPTYNVARPGIERVFDLVLLQARSVPQDSASLWQQLQSLPSGLRRQFLEAGNAYRNAQSFWPEQRTAYASFLVVSCEALKPQGRKSDAANMYDVITSLRSKTSAEELRALSLHPQDVRSKHFHRGLVFDEELAPQFGTSHFEDPTFDKLLNALHMNARICLVEWLLLGGQYKLRWSPRPKLGFLKRLGKAIAILRGAR